jgi:hypothetical protein
MARGARFAVAWLNNFSLELDRAQTMPMPKFLSGAPWSRQFFQPNGQDNEFQGGRPSIRNVDELNLKATIDAYSETLLQWFYQLSANTGSGFSQEIFSPDLLRRNSSHENDLAMVVRGSARPTRDSDSDTVESIKVRIDDMPKEQLASRGVAGLADTLWDQAY